MVFKDKSGALKVSGYIDVPKDGLYHFTPQRNGYSGDIFATPMQLYLGDRLAAQRAGPHQNSMASLPLKAGLHPFTLMMGSGKSLTTPNTQLLLSPISVKSWRKPLPTTALHRPKSIPSAQPWTCKRKMSQAQKEAKKEADMLDDLEALLEGDGGL